MTGGRASRASQAKGKDAGHRAPRLEVGRTGTTARRAARRQQLLDAADRVVRRLGPDASMDDVAAEAGITKPILYRHFGDKGGLYRALAERYTWQLLAERRQIVRNEANIHRRIRRTIDSYLSFMESDPQVYRFLTQHSAADRPEVRAALADYVHQVATDMAQEVKEGLAAVGADEAPAETWAYAILGMVQVATAWWLETRPTPRAIFVDYLTDLLWKGLADRKQATEEEQVGT
jgi:AcrR family transcriptional regulator